MSLSELECRICGAAVSSPRISLDLRVQRLNPGSPAGQMTLEIQAATELFCYCSMDCWRDDVEAVATELALSTRYPAGGVTTTCSKCEKPLDRTAPHVSYAILEARIREQSDGVYLSMVDADVEFACLCSDCEAASTWQVEQVARLALPL